MSRKLKALKADLRAWNEVFGNVEREKKLLLDFEGLEEERVLCDEEMGKDKAIIDLE